MGRRRCSKRSQRTVFCSWVGAFAAMVLACAASTAAAAGNPVSAFYDGPDGYPAWTDSIRWNEVINMAAYAKGRTNFEKFENARDELAARGGGVLFYPAGTYDFSEGPFDGPAGRGLMLKSGVVILGEAPAGKPNAARDGKLDLATTFAFGFRKKAGNDVPRDWNLVGLAPEPGKGPASVRNVGIAWVRLVGGVIYFGPDLVWGENWASAKSWKSAYAKAAWGARKPDGTHPGDAFLGAPRPADGGGYVPGARGRLVFGCVLEKSAFVNDYDTCGRAEAPEGFGSNGFHMAKFAARVAVYGSRVLVANNALLKTETGNFAYEQRTVQTIARKGNDFAIGANRLSNIMWDYNRTMGIDVNKDLLGMVREKLLEDGKGGFLEEGVIVRDNWVFNHGHKGYNVSGQWITVRGNRNERYFLQGGAPVLGVAEGWRLTLDGFIESSAGGGGMISDNLARAFDVAGSQMWIGDNVFNNTGSNPGNDGEGICCQLHGGTHITSWAITGNVREDGVPGSGSAFMGGFGVNCRGLLAAWNRTRGYVGALNMGADSADVAIVGNVCPTVLPSNLELGKGLDAKVLYVPDDGGSPVAPDEVTADAYEGDAVRVMWTDRAGKPAPAPDPASKKRPEPVTIREMGYRVDRQIEGGPWHTIAYRPPQTTGHPMNPPAWVDFLAPPGKKLSYRVLALTGHPDIGRASEATEARVLLPPAGEAASGRPGDGVSGR